MQISQKVHFIINNIVLVVVQIVQYMILIQGEDAVDFTNYIPNLIVFAYQVFYVVVYLRKGKNGRI